MPKEKTNTKKVESKATGKNEKPAKKTKPVKVKEKTVKVKEKPAKKKISKKFVSIIALASVVVICGITVLGLWLGGVFNGGGAPIYSASDRYTAEAVENNYRVDYTYTDGARDYYYVYLGKVNFVPISSEGTKYYNGKTPISLSYSSSTVTEQHIEEQNALCITNTTQTQITTRHEASVKSTTGFSYMGFSQQVEAGYTYTNESQKQKGYSNSTTKTYTSFKSWQQTNSETISYTIGEHGEKEGFYRYALFTTCDVYVVIVKDNMDETYYYEYNSFARPDSFFTAVDYNETNDFASKADAAKLEFNSSIIDNLVPENSENSSVAIYDYREHTNLTIGEVIIPTAVNQAVFIGDANRIFTMSIVFRERSPDNDLKITLNNMKFVAPTGKHAIDGNDDGSEFYTVYICLYGDNSITGAKGANGNSSPLFIKQLSHDSVGPAIAEAKAYADEKGIYGKNGTCGIAIAQSNLFVMGSGKLSVTGGAGGASGTASFLYPIALGLINLTIRNQGFTGGAGGNAIECASVSFYGTLAGNVTITGGAGVAGGNIGGCYNSDGKTVSNPLFNGATGGNGGNALLLVKDGTVEHPEIERVKLIGGKGGAPGSGKVNGQNEPDGSKGFDGKDVAYYE